MTTVYETKPVPFISMNLPSEDESDDDDYNDESDDDDYYDESDDDYNESMAKCIELTPAVRGNKLLLALTMIHCDYFGENYIISSDDDNDESMEELNNINTQLMSMDLSFENDDISNYFSHPRNFKRKYHEAFPYVNGF